MRGVVFREFLKFVADATSEGFVDDMILDLKVGSGGSDGVSGDRDHRDMLEMVAYVERKTGDDAAELTESFGRALFGRFLTLYPELFRNQTRALDFLQEVEVHIRGQLRDLYPIAVAPQLECDRKSDDELVVHLRSERPLADLCAGLIQAALSHFGAKAAVERNERRTAAWDVEFSIRTIG
ncbi:MAG: heme NO-binding domain-containing protein [Pseudomonadota bacterium]